MCTIVIEALTPLDRTLRIKMYKNNTRSRLFFRIAKRSIALIEPAKMPGFGNSHHHGYWKDLNVSKSVYSKDKRPQCFHRILMSIEDKGKFNFANIS